ncbi:MAG: FHA domain-containing protein [Planctomycetota bacterium]
MSRSFAEVEPRSTLRARRAPPAATGAPRPPAGDEPPGRTCLSLRLGARTWRLETPGLLRVGRHPSNDVVVEDPQASRFHALLRWDGQAASVEDLGSANGTRLDGTRLQGPARLQGVGRLEVGGVRLEVRVDAPPALLEGEEPTWRFAPREDARGGVVATSRELQRVLLDCEHDLRTGALELCDGEERARVVFADGRIVSARCGALEGLAALERLRRLGRAVYAFRVDVEPTEGDLDLSLQQFLRHGYWETRLRATRRHARPRP